MNFLNEFFKLLGIATRAAQYAQEGKTDEALALMKAI